MNLYLVRHGETDANLEQRYLGALDIGLNRTGEIQAERMRTAMPLDLRSVLVSPLLRAQQTAQIICQNYSVPLQTVSDFRERNVGVFEGLTQTEAKNFHPDLWQRNCTRHWHDAPTGGESIGEVVTRVGHALNKLIARYSGEPVAVIAHGFVAKTIRALALQDFSDFFDWQLANGTLLHLHLHLPEPLALRFELLQQTLPAADG